MLDKVTLTAAIKFKVKALHDFVVHYNANSTSWKQSQAVLKSQDINSENAHLAYLVQFLQVCS